LMDRFWAAELAKQACSWAVKILAERVWHEGQYDLIPSCVGSDYIRHDENGDRSVTPTVAVRRGIMAR